MALAVYNALSVPYEYCFKDEYFKIRAVIIFELTIDVFFLVDVILTFFTSFLDRTGAENYQLDDIALNYIKQPRIISDVIALFGNALFTEIHRFFALFGLLKVFRVFRIG